MAEGSKSGCCPDGALGAPGPQDYKTKGKTVSEGGLDAYVVGEGKTVVIFFPDVWGWNGGRTRLIADELASELACTVVVPKCFLVTRLGGTDGDGLNPEFDFAKDGADFGPWIKEASPTKHTEALADKAAALAKSLGAEKVAWVGTCYGAWAGVTFSGRHEAVAGVAWHPSIGLEGMMGGDAVALAAKSSCPVAIFRTNQDSEAEYGEDGSITKTLREKFGKESVPVTHVDAAHGVMNRGDPSDPQVAAAQKLCLAEGVKYLKARI